MAAEFRINIFVFGIVSEWLRIDGDEDIADARDGRQRIAVGAPGIMGRRVPGMGGIGNKKNFTGAELFIGKSGSVKLKKCRRLRKINNWQLLK